MTFVPVPQTVKVELNMLQNGIPIVNLFNVDVGHTPTGADLIALDLALINWWETQLAPNSHTSLVFQNVTATDISVANGIQQIDSTTTVPSGTVSGAAAAANAAVVVSLRTPFTGRSFRGRLYLGGMPQVALLDAQHLTTGSAAVYQSMIGSLITSLNTLGYALGVVSKFAGGVQRIVGIITEITALVTNNTIDSQRRRNAN